jgi:hypothetical protein
MLHHFDEAYRSLFCRRLRGIRVNTLRELEARIHRET